MLWLIPPICFPISFVPLFFIFLSISYLYFPLILPKFPPRRISPKNNCPGWAKRPQKTPWLRHCGAENQAKVDFFVWWQDQSNNNVLLNHYNVIWYYWKQILFILSQINENGLLSMITPVNEAGWKKVLPIAGNADNVRRYSSIYMYPYNYN